MQYSLLFENSLGVHENYMHLMWLERDKDAIFGNLSKMYMWRSNVINLRSPFVSRVKFPSPNFMLTWKSSSGSYGLNSLNKKIMKSRYQSLHDLFRSVEQQDYCILDFRKSF